MTCPDCQASPRRLCARHAAVDNHSDEVDLALERAGVVRLRAIASIEEARALLLGHCSGTGVPLAEARLTEAIRWLRDGKP